MNHRWRTGLRNGAILAAITTLVTFGDDGVDVPGRVANQVGLALVAAALGMAGYRYFASNRLKWFVIKRPLRWVIVSCGVAIVALVAAGPWVLSRYMPMVAVWALVAACGLLAVWIVVQSRRDSR